MSEYNVWQYYQGEASEGFRESYARLSALVKCISSGAKVLNIGIGDGTFELLAKEAGLNVESLDPDPKSVENLSGKLGIEAHCGSIEKIPLPDSSFDVIVLSEVLEHLTLEQAQNGLKECKRILKNNSLLLGTVPADEDLSLNMVACPCCSMRFHRWGHQQSFNQENLRALLNRDYANIQISYRKFIPWKQRSLPYRISAVAKLLLIKAGRKVQNANYLFKCNKA